MKDVRVVLAVITLLRHLCWICFFAFMAQIAYRMAPMVAESVRPQFNALIDTNGFEHSRPRPQHGDSK